MDDRITEVREAHRIVMKSIDNEWTLDDEAQHGSVKVLAAAARAYADLLDSDALIIRRDDNGEWPADVIGRVGPILEPHPSWSDPLHYRASLVVLREATVRKLDALASFEGVEPQ